MEKISLQNNVPCFFIYFCCIDQSLYTLSLNSVFYFPTFNNYRATTFDDGSITLVQIIRINAYLIMLVDRGDFRNFVEWFPEQL